VKYSLITFGCRVNQADSLAIDAALRAGGGEAVPPGAADLIVVNSCSVTAAADQGARQTIRRIARDNPLVRVVVTGCYATRQAEELRALPNVVEVISNDRKESLFERSYWNGGVGGDGPCGHVLEPGTGGRTALTIRVQTGCNESCSYCIIPRTRGTSRSKPLEVVCRELGMATAAGYKEIVVTGVHLGSYGRDLTPSSSLDALIDALAEWPADVLFRISSLEPMDCTAHIVDRVASSPRLAPHFHLPLQHGDDRMLRLMRRPYTASAYATLIDRINHLMPHASIGTDLIVGFPGETDGQFEATCAVVRGLPLSHVHVFPYSDRPGTDASAMSTKVHGSVIRERGAALRAIGAHLATSFRERQKGAIRRALTVDDGWSAVTDNYLKVRLDEQRRRNEWIDVTLA